MSGEEASVAGLKVAEVGSVDQQVLKEIGAQVVGYINVGEDNASSLGDLNPLHRWDDRLITQVSAKHMNCPSRLRI